MKTHFTRKNFIAIALSYFYVLLIVLTAICLDGNNPVMKNNNPIQKISFAMGFPKINGSAGAYMLLICVSIYILIAIAAFIFEMRLAKYYDNKIFTRKWVGIYIGTFVILMGLAFGLGSIAQYPYEIEYVKNSYLFLANSALLALIFFVVFGILITAIVSLYVNFKHIDEPFRFFGNRTKALEEEEKEKEEEELAALDEQGKLAESFGESSTPLKAGVGGFGGNGSGSSTGILGPEGQNIGEKEKVFPGLCTIDLAEGARKNTLFEDDMTLRDLCHNFRNYLAKAEGLYFSIDTIRAFISGLASSRLIILEGLSGTGKSSLARYFSEYISEESFFEAVQATWRDRSAILGYYNDFSKSYNETEFLKRLYKYNYQKDHVNIMVLDEVNISRVEYYFADFLSILEYPKDKWKIKLMQLPYSFEAPDKLQDGVLKIPENTWFIATANNDDSTYTITDKVYDRAITIAFDDRNEEFEVADDVRKVKLSFSHLTSLFKEAQSHDENKLTAKERDNFKTITDFAFEKFDLTFGNRINNQINQLVPVFVECGGTKEDALDFMFSRKVVSKLSGRFEEYIKQGLLDLKALIRKVYGKAAFPLTNKEIDRLVRKL